MDKSRDSSVLRSLAVAFGDGLAFGVGMKLTQNAAGKPGTPVPGDLASRMSRIEQRVERIERTPASVVTGGTEGLEPNVLDALMHAVEARLQENAGQLERQLAELEVKLAIDLKALRQQDQAVVSAAEGQIEEVHQRFHEQVLTLRQQVNDDRDALQNQVVALHREFAAAVADIVEEQVANQVEQRVSSAVGEQLAAIEERLREEIQQASVTRHHELTDLRHHVSETDRNVLDLLLSIGDQFRQAAGRLSPRSATGEAASEDDPPAEAAAEATTAAAPPEPTAETISPKPPETATTSSGSYSDSDLPGFAQTRKAAAGAWSVPLVSSFIFAAGCVLALQYL